MNTSASNFASLLQEQGLRYREIELDDGKSAVECGFKLNGATFKIVLIFSANGKYVDLRSYGFASAPQDRLGNVLITCNELNKQFKWVKFLVDDDGDVNAEDDAIIDPNTGADECLELMMRMADIVSEHAYPVIMKAIYG